MATITSIIISTIIVSITVAVIFLIQNKEIEEIKTTDNSNYYKEIQIYGESI